MGLKPMTVCWQARAAGNKDRFSSRLIHCWQRTRADRHLRITLIILLLFCVSLTVHAGGKEEGSHRGGKHRIRVTPDLESDVGFSFTAESNIYGGSVYENAFLEYQTGDNWSLGLYVVNMPMIGSSQSFEYDTYFSIAKWLTLNESWLVNFGTQNGTTLFQTPRQLHDFSYLQGMYKVNPYFNLSAGMFYVNRALATINQPIGATVGVDVNFIPGTLWTEFDFLSGNANISGSVINLFWRPAKPVSLYVGIQVPAANSGNDFAGNLGVSLQD